MRVMRERLSQTDRSCQSDMDNPFRIIEGMQDGTEKTKIAERLRVARREAGFAYPGDAADSMGIPRPTYYAHENGQKGLARGAARYAERFRVSLDWLLRGRGDMTTGITSIPLMGLVGAGSQVEPIGDTVAASIGEIDLPDGEHMGALIVRGDSQYPRYMDGEIILYDRRPEAPGRLTNHYAVVDCTDGRRLIKKIVRGRGVSSWTLWSHNAPEEADADILAAYRVTGTLIR